MENNNLDKYLADNRNQLQIDNLVNLRKKIIGELV